MLLFKNRTSINSNINAFKNYLIISQYRHTHIYIESLVCIPEINIILYVNCINFLNVGHEKKKNQLN